MKTGLITALVCFVVFEIFEHLILPLIYLIRNGRRKSAYGPSGLVGKICLVKQWEGVEGRVSVGCELWKARSESPLFEGDEAVIQNIEGLTLIVSSADASGTSPSRRDL